MRLGSTLDSRISVQTLPAWLKGVAGVVSLSSVLALSSLSPVWATDLGKAMALKDNGEFRGAIIVLKRGLKENPKDAEARLLLGKVYLQMGLGSAAETELERARQEGLPDDAVLFDLGRALLVQEQYDKLESRIRLRADMTPSMKAQVLTLHGLAQLGYGRPAKARQSFQDALGYDDGEAQAHLGLGRADLADKKPLDAAAHIDSALDRDPRCAECWVLKGEVERMRGDIEAARDAFVSALDLEPSNFLAHLGKAAAEIELGNPEAAQDDLEAVKEVRADHPLRNYLNAVIAYQSGDVEGADEQLQVTLKALPDHLPSNLLAGIVAFNKRQYVQARSRFETYLKGIPNNPDAIKLMAQTLLKLNEGAEAVEMLRPLVRSNPEDPTLLALFGNALFQSGDQKNGSAYLERASALVPDSKGLKTQVALSKLAEGDTKAAIADLREITSKSENKNVRDSVLLVMALLRDKDYDGAIEATQAVAKQLPDNALPDNLRGVALLGKEDRDGARAAFEAAIQVDPKFVTGYMNLARMDLSDKKLEAAKARLNAILEFDPKSEAALMELARLASLQGDAKTSEALLKRAVEGNPDALQPGVAMARLLLEKRDFEGALSAARSVYQQHPDSPLAIKSLGAAQLAAKQASSALTTFQRWVKAEPNNAQARFMLATAQAAAGNLDQAVESLNDVIKKEPKAFDAYQLLARVQADQKDYPGALRTARIIQRVFADSEQGYLIEAQILNRDGQADRAVSVLRKAQSIKPTARVAVLLNKAMRLAGTPDADAPLREWLKTHADDQAVRLVAAMDANANGQFNQAISDYEALIKAQPNNVIALNNLALLYQKLDDKRAVDTAKRAFELAPKELAIMDTYGWALVANGRAKEALPVLEQALALKPDAHEVHYHFAAALAAAGDTTRAKRELERLMVRARDFAQKDEVRALLNRLSQ